MLTPATDDWPDERMRDFTEGYHLGYWTGLEVGYGQAENDMARAWAQIAEKMRATLRQPAFAELQRRRGEA